MPCFRPVPTWVHPFKRTESGKKLLIFEYNASTCNSPIPDMHVPCQSCIGCLLSKSCEWAARIGHEASLHWNNCWLTLTLNDDYKNTRQNPYSLERGQKSEMTRFLKRLRKKYTPKNPYPKGTPEHEQFRMDNAIRFFYCGEYGETCFHCNRTERECSCGHYYPWRGRPHYHVCLFNHDFTDKRYFKTINGCDHYTSDELDLLWTDPRTGLNMGYATISDLTPDSAAYTARYSLKKIRGDLAYEPDDVTGLLHYQRLTRYGEVVDLVPEYIRMSTNPGIGKHWLDQFSKEILDNDTMLFKELRIKPAAYYDKKLALSSPEIFEENKQNRIDRAKNNPDNTPQRLHTREYIALQKASKLHRKEI